MPPPQGPEKIESKQSVGDANKHFASTDIDRSGTTKLDKQAAQDNLTKLFDKIDNSKTSEIAKNTYEKPNTAQERNDAARNMRESTTSVGTAQQRNIVDQSGNKTQVIESVDKKTGETSRYAPGPNGQWQKLDTPTKPANQPERQQNQNSAELLAQRQAHQEQQRQASQIQRDAQQQSLLAPRDGKPEQAKPAQPEKPVQPEKHNQAEKPAADQQAQRQAQQNQLRDAQQTQQKDLQQNPRHQAADSSDLLAKREAHRQQQAEPAPPRGADLNHDGKPDKPWQNPDKTGADKTPAGNDRGQQGGQPAPQDGGTKPAKIDSKPDAGAEATKPRPDSTVEQGRPNNQQWQRNNNNDQAQGARPLDQPVRPTSQAQQQQGEQNPQGYRPAQRFNDGPRPDQSWQTRPDAQRWDRPDGQGPRPDRVDAGPRFDRVDGQRPDGSGPRGDRGGDGSQRSFDQSRQSLQPGDPRNFDRGGRPDFVRPDQLQGKQLDGTIPGGRPSIDSLKGQLPDGRLGPNLDVRALPGLDGRIVPGLDGRGPQTFLDGRGIHQLDGRGIQPGDLAKGLMPGQMPLDGKFVFNLKAELNGGRFDAMRGDLQNQFMQNLRTLNQDQLLTIQRSLSTQPGELAIRGLRPGMEADRAGLQTGKAIDGVLGARDLANGRVLTAEPLGKQIATLLDSLNKSMQLDRVPGADQSRLVMKELFTGMKLDQTNLQESMQIQRSLNMRNAENSTQQTLTLKPGQIEAVRELVNAVRNQDLITKDASKTIEASHTIDAKTAANILSTKQGVEADLASKQDQNKAVKDAITKDAQNKQQDANSNMPDRRLVNSETKAESNQVKNNNAENGTGNKQNQNQDDKKDKVEANKGKKPEQNEDELAIITANKMRELKEKELKEKEKQKEKDQEKSKKDPQQKSRLKYRVKEGDTLSAISAKFLNNAELAPAIFHINRTVIPVITHNEKTYASLPINSMIWIPCDDDLETFKDSGVGKQYEHIGFAGVQYGSAEEELAARFGRRWFGPTKEERADKSTRIANIEKVLGREEEIARPQFKGDRDKRRANIEAILGPLSEKPADGRARYTVRLGETLKSIAVKHPSINNVDAWKLIASLNGLETETDSKGTPIAILKRGTVIILPSKAEVEKFLAERKLAQVNFAPQAKAVLTSM